MQTFVKAHWAYIQFVPWDLAVCPPSTGRYVVVNHLLTPSIVHVSFVALSERCFCVWACRVGLCRQCLWLVCSRMYQSSSYSRVDWDSWGEWDYHHVREKVFWMSVTRSTFQIVRSALKLVDPSNVWRSVVTRWTFHFRMASPSDANVFLCSSVGVGVFIIIEFVVSVVTLSLTRITGHENIRTLDWYSRTHWL